MYHSKNGISTNANVSTRMATSHFLAIAGLGDGLEGAAETSAAFITVVMGISPI
jgi:hypothetical protein